MKECIIKEFALNFKYANHKLAKHFPRNFEDIKIKAWLNIINKHNAYPVKWYKPTKDGLKVKCKTFDDEDDFLDMIKQVQDYCTEVNKRLGTKFEVKNKEG